MCNSDIGFVIAQEEIWHRTTRGSAPKTLRQASFPQARVGAPLPPARRPRNPPEPRCRQASHRHPDAAANPRPQHRPRHARLQTEPPRRAIPPQAIPIQPAAPQAIPQTFRPRPHPAREARLGPPHRKASHRPQPAPAHPAAPRHHTPRAPRHNPHTAPPCHRETSHQHPPSGQSAPQAPPYGANGVMPSTSCR